jgi:hypothetical protein
MTSSSNGALSIGFQPKLFGSTRITAVPSNPRGGHYPSGGTRSNLPITRSEESVTIRESRRSNILTVPGVYGLESAKLGTPTPPQRVRAPKALAMLGLFYEPTLRPHRQVPVRFSPPAFNGSRRAAGGRQVLLGLVGKLHPFLCEPEPSRLADLVYRGSCPSPGLRCGPTTGRWMIRRHLSFASRIARLLR